MKLIVAPDSESVYLPVVVDKYPKLSKDTSLLIPKIIDIVDPKTNETKFYLHITPWLGHIGTLSDILITLWMTKRTDQVQNLMIAVGQFLKNFRNTYLSLNHNDFNPSNILIQPLEGAFSFVMADCAGLDDEVGNDYDSFLKSIDVLAEGGFGEEFKTLAVKAFELGYSMNQ